MKNILMGVSYLGTNYAGWQSQENALGIQEVIENALFEICGKQLKIYASGRTDAGVHAIEQCFSCEINFSETHKLPIALNNKLPKDIRILWAKEVDKNFHARFSAHKKTYVYRIKTEAIESPFDEAFTTYVSYNLDIEKMKKAAGFLVGTHNFKAFCSAKATVPDFEREVYYINITKTQNLFEFEVCGNGFLYNMVRIIVGTLVDVGRDKILPEKIKDILKSEDRQFAGKTMPANGLILKSVEY